jgi:hypothetical protein
MRIVKKKR